jgi:glycerol-3-phosphate acyltransferase PlsY
MIELVVKVVAAYLLGGLMGGDVMRVLLGGGDLRQAGSGNVGATNALRTRGPKFAIGVLLIDIGKGVLAVLLIPVLPWPLPETSALSVPLLGYACGVAVALGHCYPAFKRFIGGKGVATLAGVFAALLPWVFLWMLGGFVLVTLLSGYVGLASVAAAVTALFVVGCFGAGLWSATGAFTAAMTALIVFKHRQNLARIAAGSEHRFERARLLGRPLDRLFDRKPKAP